MGLWWGSFDRKLVLQRFAQRPAAAVEGQPPGGRRSGRHAARRMPPAMAGRSSACAVGSVIGCIMAAFSRLPVPRMIRKLLRRVFRARPAHSARKPEIIPACQPRHPPRPVSQRRRARLRNPAEGRATRPIVVGGAVRDLIAGIEPKDFDVATNATPEQVRGLFRRSRIIGRRFQIVHVMMGPETLEVTTFRGRPRRRHAEGRTRPRAARQRLRQPGGRCGAARLHHQRAVLRSDHRSRDRLPPRRRRPPAENPAHDRRAARPLPRRPGAHAARRAPRRQARPEHRPGRCRRRSAKWPT